ncbi:MAG: DedA family protein [Archangium sp.]|nr:DedA family protein [Archangium sp.]
MEDFLFSLVDEAAGGAVSYLLVFAILIACGLGVPLPEDVSLILGGYLVYSEKAHLLQMMGVGYLGIIIGDSMVFFAGRRIGSKVGQKPGGFFARIVTPEKRARVEQLFKRHGEKIVMIARFLPGVRSPAYFTAGSVGMKWSHFAFYDSVAALASAPIFVFLGFKFGGELDALIDRIRRGQQSVLIALAAIGVIIFFVSRWRSKREQKLNEEALRLKAKEVLSSTGADTQPPTRSPITPS